MPRSTRRADRTRPTPEPNHAAAARLTRRYRRLGPPSPPTVLTPDAAAGASAHATAAADELVPCLEERGPGLLVVRFRPVWALEWPLR